MRVRGYIFCVPGCPYKAEVQPGRVADIAAELLNMVGCYEISLGDTIGVGTPGKTRNLVEVVAKKVPLQKSRRTFSRHIRSGAGPRLVSR